MTARNQTIALIGAIAIVLLVLVGASYAFIAGRALDTYLPLLLAFAVPVITTLLSSAGIKNELRDVHKKVNGNYSNLTGANAELNDKYAAVLAALPPHIARSLPPLDLMHSTGSLPMVPPEAGRHRAADDDLHLAEPVECMVDASGAGTAQASAVERTVTGLVLPWNKIGKTTAGPLKIRSGATRLPRDISRCKLYSDHTGTPNHKPVGHAIGWHTDAAGLHMTFRVGRTADGDAALADITEGIRDAFSAELSGITRNGNEVTDSITTGVALVSTPAFSDARVAEVHAQHTTTEGNTTMDVRKFMLALIAAGVSEADARLQALAHFSQAEVDAVTFAADELELTPATVTQAPAAAPAPAAPAAELANASHTLRPAVVPSGLPQATAPANLSLSQAIDTIRMVQSGRGHDVAHAALTDITATAMIDGTPPAWLGELWSGRMTPRRIIPLMGSRALTSWRIQGFKWTQKPAVAAYAGNKAEIPTNAVAIAPYEAEATRWAGGHDLDRKFYDFGDNEILESYWRAMNESYAVVTDANAADWLVANATAAGTAADLFRAIVTAQSAVDDALGVGTDYVLGNPTDRMGLLDITAADLPAYAALFGVDLSKIVWTNRVPAGTIVAGAKPAAVHHELPGSPLRVEAEHLSHGGRDAALFGYTALTLNNAAGLVKVTIDATP